MLIVKFKIVFIIRESYCEITTGNAEVISQCIAFVSKSNADCDALESKSILPSTASILVHCVCDGRLNDK